MIATITYSVHFLSISINNELIIHLKKSLEKNRMLNCLLCTVVRAVRDRESGSGLVSRDSCDSLWLVEYLLVTLLNVVFYARSLKFTKHFPLPRETFYMISVKNKTISLKIIKLSEIYGQIGKSNKFLDMKKSKMKMCHPYCNIHTLGTFGAYGRVFA